MRALLTGLNGTVAPALAEALRARGVEVIGWDRRQVPADDPEAGRAFLRRVRPDVFFHVATGPEAWAERLARVCADDGVRFVFTGSVSVFAEAQAGPFAVSDPPAPDDDYGRYKLACERLVQAAHPEALVARIGWQIGEAPGGNHMVDFLDRQQRETGRVVASARWMPACSFLADTAEALADLAATEATGVYHLDGNPGLSFFAIAERLNERLGRPWRVEPEAAPAMDRRMVDPRLRLRPITERLGG